MNLLAWSLLFQVIGTIFLSLHIFRSKQEEDDNASSWWGANPFSGFKPLLKFISFIGLVLIIFGFSIQFSMEANKITTMSNEISLAIAITSIATLIMYLFYNISAWLYMKNRYKHFAKFPLEIINKYLSDKSNDKDREIELLKQISGYLENLPNEYGNYFSDILRSTTIDQQKHIINLKTYLEKMSK